MADDDYEGIPDDIAEAMRALTTADDETVWRAARSHQPFAHGDQIEELHLKRQRGEPLTDAQQRYLAELLHEYEYYMLVHAQAAALLKRRGYDVNILLEETRAAIDEWENSEE
jgi:hypothetical protein